MGHSYNKFMGKPDTRTQNEIKLKVGYLCSVISVTHLKTVSMYKEICKEILQNDYSSLPRGCGILSDFVSFI